MSQEALSVEAIIGNYKLFLDKIFGNLKNAGFDVGEFRELDHIAYRTESAEVCDEIKRKLVDFSSSFDYSLFHGRMILVCRLKEPLEYGGFRIECIEVIAPKEDNQFKEGLEHAEFIPKSTLQEFLEKHNDVKFNLNTYTREINPELTFECGDCAIKFHPQNLLEVIGI